MNSASKIILGTVQFGLDYGINNSTGKPSTSAVFDILDFAFESGIEILDTANAYGDAELILGEYFKKKDYTHFQVCSKFSEVQNLEKIANETLKRLNIKNLFGFSFHNYDCYKSVSSEESKKLIDLKYKGLIKSIGVSIYTNDQLNDVIDAKWIDMIQLPFNLLDKNPEKRELLKEAKELGKIIHTRSVFLQGLFYKNANKLPDKLKELKPYLVELNTIARENKLSVRQLALNYVLQDSLIDNVLVGVDNLEQLKQNLSSIVPLSEDVISRINEINVKEAHLLNPANWN